MAERVGHNCGPIGVNPSAQGDYCIRPMLNLSGMGRGGFFKYSDWPFAARDAVPHGNPAYFWCEWFTGDHNFTSYIDDVAVYNALGTQVVNGKDTRWEMVEDPSLSGAIPMPAILQGISKYMYVEHIDGNVIEAAPRHTPASARQVVIDDYKATVDPTYDPLEDDALAFGAYDMDLVADPAGGFAWTADESSRRVFVNNP